MRPQPPWSKGLLALLWLWSLAVTWMSFQVFLANNGGSDFGSFYKSTQAWFQTADLYDPRGIGNVNLNPPHATLILITPLLWLPTDVAALIWVELQFIAAAVAFMIIRRELQLPASRLVWILPLFLASSAVQHHWREGQVGGLLLLLATLAWRAARRERGYTALWAAAAISLKPWLACWLPVLRGRSWMRTIAIGLAGLCAGVALMGTAPWFEWIDILQQRPVHPTAWNMSLVAALARVAGATLVKGDGMWPYGQPLLPFVVVAIVWLTWRARTGSIDRAFVLFGIAGILVSPIGWVYYLVIITGPLIAWGEEHGWPPLSRLAVGLLLVPREMMLWLAVGPTGLLGSSLAFLGTMLLWSTVLWFGPRGAALQRSPRVSTYMTANSEPLPSGFTATMR